MNKVRTLTLFCASALFVACGGGSGESSSGSSTAPGNATAGDETAPAGSPTASPTPEVDELHDALAPVFHMEAGTGRATAACEASARFGSLSRAVQGAAAPAGADAAGWATAGTNLVTTADALSAECTATGPAVEERLSTFHDAFHAVMDAAGSRHPHEAHAAE